MYCSENLRLYAAQAVHSLQRGQFLPYLSRFPSRVRCRPAGWRAVVAIGQHAVCAGESIPMPTTGE